MRRTPDLLQQYCRLLTAAIDFKQANYIATVITEDGLHQQEDGRLLKALNCSLIISYCRPFARGNPRRCKKDFPLPLSFTATFSPEERHLHNVALYDRNKLLAHSDTEARQFAPVVLVIKDSKIVVPYSVDAHAPLVVDAVAMLQNMSNRLHLLTLEERRKIEPLVIEQFPSKTIEEYMKECREAPMEEG